MAVQVPNRIELARAPTPLMPLARVGARLGGGQVWIKRDDLTGLELSGNKVRKLEYVVADALGQGCDTLVTEGAWQSNHCRATAAAAARLGLRAHLLLREWPPVRPARRPDNTGPPVRPARGPDATGRPDGAGERRPARGPDATNQAADATDMPVWGNNLLDRLFGATIESFDAAVYAGQREALIAGTLERLRGAGARARWIPTGASEPLGCWGYIRAACELAVQMRELGVASCDLVVAVSSGGTLAGLVLGKLLHRLDTIEVWGVPVSDDAGYHRANVSRLCQEAIEQFGLPIRVDDDDLRLIDGYVGEGYALPYERALAARRELAETEGLVLDPVYTAKAFAAVLDGVRAGRFGRARPVVFLHTGGIFSNFGWPELL